jgi:hypothetical protein
MRLDTVHGLRTVVNTSSLGTTASICPGWVDTPMNRKLAEELGGMNKLGPIIKRQQPLPRMITTREVGNAVCFLASDDASATTGAALCVDGAASVGSSWTTCDRDQDGRAITRHPGWAWGQSLRAR